MSDLEPPPPPNLAPTGLKPLVVSPPGAQPPVTRQTTSGPPKRGWILIVSAVLVMAQSVLFLSICLAGVVTGDPFAIIGSVVFGPLATFIGLKQYGAVVRRSAKSARHVGIMLAVLSGFWLFALVTNVGEAMIERDVQLALMAGFVGVLSTISAQLAIAARANLRWAKALAAAETAGAIQPTNSYTLRELLGFISVIAVTTGIASAMIRSELPRTGEHVDRSHGPSGIPAGATDISYHRGHRGNMTYEFTIDEQSFVDWVQGGIGSIESESSNTALAPINGSTSIYRYNAFESGPNDSGRAEVTNGLEYHWTKEDRGVHAVFDRDTNRAYYDFHSY